jgi:DNA-binding CsgD family transcriptional regulator
MARPQRKATARQSSGELADADVRRLVRLLADVAILDGDHTAKKRRLMDGLCALVEADGWLWTMTKVDLERDAPMSLGILHGGLTDRQVAGWIEMNHDLAHPPPEHVPLGKEVRRGRHFTRSRDQLVDDDTWYSHPTVKRCRLQRDLDHSMHSIYPLDEPGVISGVGLYRRRGRPAFTPRQRRIAHIVLSEVDWLHYADLPSHRGSAVPTLSPRQRVVLVLLLEGRTGAEIAELLHISPHTVHDHRKAIYRHFDVSSQIALIRRFKAGDGRDTISAP